MLKIFSSEYRPYLLITAFGILIFYGIHIKHNADIESLKQDYIKTSHTESAAVAKTIEHRMHMFYQGLRTIARLPGVREIDHYAKLFDINTRISVQEIYNNLYTNVSLSEIYLVPVYFDPERIDPNTGKKEKPTITFDELIIGQHADTDLSSSDSISIEEIEIFEYRLMKQQLGWFKNNVPTLDNIKGLGYPVVTGKEILTCDNSLFSPTQPDDAARSGIVYSVPFYGMNGNFKGMVSGVVLTKVLQGLLPENFYVLNNNQNSYNITPNGNGPWKVSKSWYLASKANPDVIYSEVIDLNIMDASGNWDLWIGADDSYFWNKPQVRYAKRFTALAYIASFFLIATLYSITIMLTRRRKEVENQNIILEKEVADRTTKLEASEARFHTIISNAADGIITINKEGIIKTFNKAAEIAFGFSSTEIHNKNIGMLIPSLTNQKSELEIHKYLTSRQESKYDEEPEELTGHHKTGSVFPLEINFSEVATENDSYYIGIVRDITARKQIEQKMIEAKNSAESSSRTKSEFLANMSHELRTPLNAIIGYSEILYEELSDIDDKIHTQDLSKIMASGKHLLALINNILDISKIESGKIQLYYETIDASHSIKEISSTIEPTLTKNNNEIVVDIIDNIGTIQTDLTRFRQILFNLLSNANKFTKDGSIKITVGKITIEDIDHIKITVSDTGIGIADHEIDNIFKKFSQADASTTRQFGGTGLGLAITQRFCNLMGGSISVSSEKDAGSRFTVILPVCNDLEEQETYPQIDPDNSNLAETVRLKTDLPREERRKDVCKVLVVDDDPVIHDMMRRMLTKEGFKVYSAHNGIEAIQLANTLVPNLITLDIMMPNMDGWAVLRNLKSTPELANIPVIMLSMLDEKSMGEALGAADFITKPIEKNRILDQIFRHVRKPL